MSKEGKTKEVTKREEGALAVNLFEADADKGAQNITQEDLALPFLKVLMPLSPEVNEKDGKYVEGAKAGMIFNSVTKELYDGAKGINVLPCHYLKQYVEWQDRGKSIGGPVAIHRADSDIMSKVTRDKSNKDRLANGNYIETTANHFLFLLGNNPSTALISMKSTSLSVSRKWLTTMLGIKLQGKDGLFTPPTYSHIYNLRTVQMTNDKGTWFGWTYTKVGPVKDKTAYDMAKTFSERISKGEVKVKHGTEDSKSEGLY
jgi:hypothetical protein